MLLAIIGSTKMRIQERTKLLHGSQESKDGSKSKGIGKLPFTNRNIIFKIIARFMPLAQHSIHLTYRVQDVDE